MVKDIDSSRNDWPVGMIERTFESKDGLVRKVAVAVVRDGKHILYMRPVTELVTLLEVN